MSSYSYTSIYSTFTATQLRYSIPSRNSPGTTTDIRTQIMVAIYCDPDRQREAKLHGFIASVLLGKTFNYN